MTATVYIYIFFSMYVLSCSEDTLYHSAVCFVCVGGGGGGWEPCIEVCEHDLFNYSMRETAHVYPLNLFSVICIL